MNGMIFRSFRKRNSSQKNTNTVYSEYSYSGIVPKERALSLSSKFQTTIGKFINKQGRRVGIKYDTYEGLPGGSLFPCSLPKLPYVPIFPHIFRMFSYCNFSNFVPCSQKLANVPLFPCSLRYFANVPLFPKTPGRPSLTYKMRST